MAPIPIIDSHIHLYPNSELSTLAWCNPSHPLAAQHSVEDYLRAASSASSSNAVHNTTLKGFIFIETDRVNDLSTGIADGSGWGGPLKEVEWLRRITDGTPRAGEGHTEDHSTLALGIVPWAPLPSGVAALERYVALVRERAGEKCWARIRGWRYLVQDKAPGTMLGKDFGEGVKWLGRKGWVFEVGADMHRGGKEQMQEVVEMVGRAHEGVAESEKTVFVLDHLLKPNLTIPRSFPHVLEADPHFTTWRTTIEELGMFSKTYIKVSGCFSELPPQMLNADPEEIFQLLQPWLSVILTAFGPSRIMFGSDWPVCTVGVSDSWEKWRSIVKSMCQWASLSSEEEELVWSGTAIKAYNIGEVK